jgi:hypothetical protein
MTMIKEYKNKLIDTAFSYGEKRINASDLNDAIFLVARLADVIEQQNGFDKKGLTKSQRRACEIVSEQILKSLNKSLTVEKN